MDKEAKDYTAEFVGQQDGMMGLLDVPQWVRELMKALHENCW